MEYLIFDVESTTKAKGNPYSKYTSLVLCGFKSSRYGYINLYRDFDKTVIQNLFAEHDFIVTFNGKFDLGWLLAIDIPPETWYSKKLWDVQLYYFLEHDQQSAYPSLNEVSVSYGGEKKFDFIKENYWDKGIDTDEIPKEELITYCDQDLDVTEFCFLKQYNERFGDPKKFQLFRLQQQDQKVLLEMEYNGLKLDVDACQKADDETQIKIKEKEKQLFGLFPHFNNVPINLNSNDHKSCMLYGGTIIETVPVPIGVFKTGARAGQVKYKNTEFKHELPRLVNPLPEFALAKEGYYATNDKALKSLSCKGDVKKLINLLLERQKLEKLSGTYFAGWPKKLDEYGWENNIIHSSLNQCKVQTGRLSSDKPNQQNVPSEMKHCFVTRF